MKKILAVISTLSVAGALIFSPVADKDQKPTVAPKENIVMMSDPGVGW
ncbi:hypothetical protein AB1I81_28295 [Bacillus mobilis]|uniref:Complement C1q protein n=1 Tax=Bacillus mobilis TaxID=2026190 RepID=A0ABV4S3A3_9BACI|nr:hypothetical protein [Bacillus pacificus]MCU5561949.1 hypothetical protein [Bacillus pacificus]